MEQRNLPETMHKEIELDFLGQDILQFILEQPHTPNILSGLAGKIGSILDAEVCIIVAAKNSSQQTNGIGYWQENSTFLATNVLQKLARLSLDSLQSERLDLLKGAKLSLSSLIDPALETLPSKTWLGIITQYQHQTNGLVLLLKSGVPEEMNSETEILSRTSDSMAIAISQIQLQQQTQTQARYQSLLRNISREISQSSHPQELFKTCLAHICNALKLDRGMTVMLKYKNPLRAKHRQKQSVKGTARITSLWNAQDATAQSDSGLKFNLNNSHFCQQAWCKAPNYLAFEADAPFPDLTVKSHDLLHTDGSALLMMPLMGKKSSDSDPASVLGFLVLQYNREHIWSPDELDLIDWVSIQLSTALVHYQTLTQVQSIVEERTSQLKWSLDVQAKLSTRMRQQIEQLQKLNLLKDDFMSSMSHELKTPLTSMKMAIMMLRQANISPEMREKYLDILEQEWNREYDLIKDLLTLQSMESGELNYTPEELNLSQIITSLAKPFTDKWQSEKGIKLQTNLADPNLKINTDVESLENILSELLLNAAKYSEENTIIQLYAQSQTTIKGKNIIISITNQGIEITPEEMPHIFDKFRRGKGVTDRAVPGTGLGLALVKHLVEHLNGTIEVTNEPKNKKLSSYLTTFILKLPQFQPSIS